MYKLIFVHLSLLLSVLSINHTLQATPLNIVYIIADDVSWTDFGCYGNQAVRTPHIDKLAAEGMRFTEVFLTASSCSPSRCSIISGRYPHNNGAAELHSPLPANQIPFPLLLKEAGYYTVQSGKSHMGQDALRAFTKAYEMKEAGNGGEARWVSCLKERPKDKPFFAWFASTDAHRKWHADDFGTPHDPETVIVPPYLADTKETRKDIASYYNEIARFDYYVGEVVQEIARQGISDNTLIMVMADNGMPFPRAKTRVYDSGMKTPFVVKWPAGIAEAGRICNSLISAVDIAPTLVHLAGLDPIPAFQGKSFAELLVHPEKSFRQYVFSEHNWHDFESHERMLRSKDFLYVLNSRPQFPNGGPADSKRSPSQYALNQLRDAGQLSPAQADIFVSPRPVEELYNVKRDPHQLLNLASVPAYQPLLSMYRNRMKEWREQTKDNTPQRLTGDAFSRATGELLDTVKAFNQLNRGEMPGSQIGAMEVVGQPGFFEPHEEGIPATYSLQYEQDFERETAIHDFQLSDPAAYKMSEEKGNHYLELFQPSTYRAKVRSPFGIAMIDQVMFGDFIVEVDLCQTGRNYGHRDMCIFWGMKDASNFYYVHMASKTDDHAHNIFLVNDEPRVKISTRTTDGIDWGEAGIDWHKVRVARTISDGMIRVYFDDMQTPIMEATDHHFDWGHIGFGSFDDSGKIDNIKIWAPEKKTSHKPDFFKK